MTNGTTVLLYYGDLVLTVEVVMLIVAVRVVKLNSGMVYQWKAYLTA